MIRVWYNIMSRIIPIIPVVKNAQLYLTAKKIHRLFVLIVLVTGLVMMITGVFMREGQYFFFDPVLVRYLHNRLSILFIIVLGIMMLTGLYLFLFPYLPNKQEDTIIKQ